MKRLAARSICALALLAGAADAQVPSTSVSPVTVTARRPKAVDPVTVTATDWCPRLDPVRHPADRAPRVVDSYPAAGGVAAPGAVMVRVSFDAPMSCYSEVTVQGGDDDVDPCQPSGTWVLPDRRSWLMACRLQPGVAYTMRFEKVDGAGFVGLSGRRAEPFVLSFTTSTAAPTGTLQAAERADPGAPNAARITAYVTCADEKAATTEASCRHQRFARPQS